MSTTLTRKQATAYFGSFAAKAPVPTDAEWAAAMAKVKARAAREAADRLRRQRKLRKHNHITSGFDRPGGILVAQDGVKLSTRQQAESDDAAEALSAIDWPLPAVLIKTTDYEAVKAGVADTIRAGTVEQITEKQRLMAETKPRAMMTRLRKMPEVIPGTEHLDVKQRATLADMRRRLRESETALAAYRNEGVPAHVIAKAEQWVKSRTVTLESKMRQFGITTTTEK